MTEQRLVSTGTIRECDFARYLAYRQPGHVLVPDTIIDGKTKLGGCWAWMCPACHAAHGIGLGIGRGQEYRNEASPQRELLKV